MSTTVAELVEQARGLHWAFRETDFPDGAALQFVNARQRSLLAKYGANIEGLVNVSTEIALEIDGLLVGIEIVSGEEVPFLDNSTEIGWAVHEEAGTGYPYIDIATDTPIAYDPFGVDGGNPGIPLPENFVRLTKAVLVHDDDTLYPLEVVAEGQRLERNRHPVAFVNGNRLVPARPKSEENTDGIWDDIASIQLSYIPVQELTAMTDVLELPEVLMEALRASLAYAFARQSRHINAVDRKTFENDEKNAESQLMMAATDTVRADNRRIYRR